MRYVGLLGVAVLSYAAGVVTYYGTLGLLWGQWRLQDLEAVALWGGLAYGVVAFPLYLIVFLGLHLARRGWKETRGRLAAWRLPVIGALLGLAPVYAIMQVWGGGLSRLASEEALLFYSFFGASGVCFGLGWWWLFERGANSSR